MDVGLFLPHAYQLVAFGMWTHLYRSGTPVDVYTASLPFLAGLSPLQFGIRVRYGGSDVDLSRAGISRPVARYTTDHGRMLLRSQLIK